MLDYFLHDVFNQIGSLVEAPNVPVDDKAVGFNADVKVIMA